MRKNLKKTNFTWEGAWSITLSGIALPATTSGKASKRSVLIKSEAEGMRAAEAGGGVHDCYPLGKQEP